MALDLLHGMNPRRVPVQGCYRSTSYYTGADGGLFTVSETFGSGNCSEERWDCRSSQRPCISCGSCHGVLSKDASRVVEVHKVELPKFQWRMAAGDKIPWGDGGALVAEKDGSFTELDAEGKPVWRIPAGSIVLRGRTTGRPEVILLSAVPITIK
ncbi:MAG: hypothetical protein L0271_05485 [Gemmatimonadetes bacterium]|nr:hypothetical protein [Gemmatimonadota bacterium]